MDPAAAAAAAVCHVVAMPYPGRGHINPMMNLCRRLSSLGLHVTFVVTEEWLRLLTSGDPPPSNVRLRSIPNVIPSEFRRAADFAGFLEAVYTKMEAPFEQLLDGLDPPPSAVVADTYLPWAVAVGRRRGIPVGSLFTMAAKFFDFLYNFDRIPTSGDRHSPVTPAEAESDEPLEKYIPSLTSIRRSDIEPLLSLGMSKSLEALNWARKSDFILFTSFYELEPRTFDSLRASLHCPIYPVGPSIPYTTLHSGPTTEPLYSWLDSQPEKSVLYVSLGSFLSVSGPQMDEIAAGLIASGVRFLWVARDRSSQMQEICGGNGLGLVVPWCDQLRVLCHPSVGGFFSHCGWNSTLEGVFAGVPMIAFPIIWDQFFDKRMIVDEWRTGLGAKKEKALREDFVGREEITEVARRLMDLDGAEGMEMRRRAAELGEASRRAVEEGGSSNENLNAFVRDLFRV